MEFFKKRYLLLNTNTTYNSVISNYENFFYLYCYNNQNTIHYKDFFKFNSFFLNKNDPILGNFLFESFYLNKFYLIINKHNNIYTILLSFFKNEQLISNYNVFNINVLFLINQIFKNNNNYVLKSFSKIINRLYFFKLKQNKSRRFISMRFKKRFKKIHMIPKKFKKFFFRKLKKLRFKYKFFLLKYKNNNVIRSKNTYLLYFLLKYFFRIKKFRNTKYKINFTITSNKLFYNNFFMNVFINDQIFYKFDYNDMHFYIYNKYTNNNPYKINFFRLKNYFIYRSFFLKKFNKIILIKSGKRFKNLTVLITKITNKRKTHNYVDFFNKFTSVITANINYYFRNTEFTLIHVCDFFKQKMLNKNYLGLARRRRKKKRVILTKFNKFTRSFLFDFLKNDYNSLKKNLVFNLNLTKFSHMFFYLFFFKNYIYHPSFFHQYFTLFKTTSLTHYNNYLPIHTLTKPLRGLIFTRFQKSFTPNFYKYFYYYVSSYVEFFTKKNIFIKLKTKIKIDPTLYSYINSLFYKHKSFQSRIGRGFFFIEMLEII